MVANKYFGIIAIVVFVLSPCATPLTFDFPCFPNGNNTLSLEGDAFIDGKVLRLTKTVLEDSQNVSVGRATYTQPFLLRESSTGKLADFTTSFTFLINSGKRESYRDGLAFFLAPLGTLLRNSSTGPVGSLGLPINSTLSNEYPYVAVEFDIFQYENSAIGDSSYSFGHVGIDVNSLNSVITKPWNVSMKEGQQNSAKISYSFSTKILRVAFTTYDDRSGIQVMSYLSYGLDLKKYLPDWVVVGFSASTGRSITLHNIISWNFTSTYSLVDYELSLVSAPAGLSSKAKPRKHNRHLVVISSIIGGFMLVGVLGLGLFNSCKKKAKGESSTHDFADVQGLRRFSYREMALATRNFAKEEKLGEGGHSEVYKGFRYDMNSYVAVQRISKGCNLGKKYASEIKILSHLHHQNLMTLIGWCYEKEELLLVYEFMPNGSLDFHLFKAERLLIWEIRYKIAQELASVVLFLHEGCDQRVIHRNIKSSNIMLDSDFNTKLGNFRLTELVHEGSPTAVVDATLGYLDSAYFAIGAIGESKKLDVYSFGVVALEIACGRKPIDLLFEEDQIVLVKWVWELYREGKIIEAADPKLRGDFDKKQMECLMVVGMWCAHSNYNFRPSIHEAVQVLNFEGPLPELLSNDTTGSGFESSQNELSATYGDSTNSSQFTTYSTSSSPTIPIEVEVEEMVNCEELH